MSRTTDDAVPPPAAPPPAPDEPQLRPYGAEGGAVALLNVANLLTMVRIALVPGFVLLLVHGDGHDPAWRSFAWAAFGVAMITDFFDGELARRYGLVTDFGKIADPIADKAIMGAALIGLSAQGDLPWWITVVIIVRELGITLLRFWVIRYGVIPASRGGKLKTLTQGVGVGMYILILTGPLASIRAWVMAVAVVLTVASGVDYVRQAVVLRRGGSRARAAAQSVAGGVAGGPSMDGGAGAGSAGSVTGGVGMGGAASGGGGADRDAGSGTGAHRAGALAEQALADGALAEGVSEARPAAAVERTGGARGSGGSGGPGGSGPGAGIEREGRRGV